MLHAIVPILDVTGAPAENEAEADALESYREMVDCMKAFVRNEQMNLNAENN